MKRSGSEAEENFSNKIRTGVQRDVRHSPQTKNAEAPLSTESVPDPSLKQEEDEPMDEAKEPFEDFEKIAHADVPGNGNSVQMFQNINREIAEKRHLNALKIYIMIQLPQCLVPI